jgi:hypothetical protein
VIALITEAKTNEVESDGMDPEKKGNPPSVA